MPMNILVLGVHHQTSATDWFFFFPPAQIDLVVLQTEVGWLQGNSQPRTPHFHTLPGCQTHMNFPNSLGRRIRDTEVGGDVIMGWWPGVCLSTGVSDLYAVWSVTLTDVERQRTPAYLLGIIPLDGPWKRQPTACWVMLAHAGQGTAWLRFFLLPSSRLK